MGLKKTFILVVSIIISQVSLANPSYPYLQVPRMSQPPAIDGEIKLEEWVEASSITGVVTWCAEGSPGQPPTMVPEIQQVRWYLGYDDRYFYLAMDSPHPEGSVLTANVKKNDEGYLILWDDHTEIQLSSSGRKFPEGFYKIMVNPRGYFSDQWWFSGTPGAEDRWQSGAIVKSRVTATAWQLELAIPFKSLNLPEKPDGQRIVGNLVRTDFCGGIYFAGWAGGSWMSWDIFPEMELSPEAPTFHWEKIGDVPSGVLDTRISLRTRRPREEVEVIMRLLNAEGKEIYSEMAKAELVLGKTSHLSFFRKDLPLSPEKDERGNYQQNFLEIIVTSLTDGKSNKSASPVYQARIPVIRMTQRYWNQFIKPWQERRETAGEYAFNFAHYPYTSQFEVWVDLDLFGVPKEIQSASHFLVKIIGENKKVVAWMEGKIQSDLSGHVLTRIPELSPGKYEALLQLFDRKGKVIAEKKQEFLREKWIWERNQIGKEDVVIPPFIPVGLKKNEITTWNRKYFIGRDGLPEKITIGGGEKNPGLGPDLLGGQPISVWLLSEGKKYDLTGEGWRILEVRPTAVVFLARGKIGPVQILSQVTVEYDGWYLVKMNFIPEHPVKVKEMAMNWTVPEADTLVVMRGDTVEQGYFGAFPAGEGVVWESTQLNPVSNLLGSWAPACFIGTGEKGLWYFGESDESWCLDDNQPAIVAERINGNPSLRFRFINHEVTLDKPREIVFALQAVPEKPLPEKWRLTAWGMPGGLEYVHDTRGYRMYGASVDGFELYSEDDYKRLRDTYLGIIPPPKEAHGCRSFLKPQRPLVLYGSGRMTGISREFKTFAGEWLGRTNYRGLLKPENTFKGKASDAGIIWQTEDEVSPCGVYHTESFLDYHLWYHKNLVEKVFLNGTWWDNASIDYGGPEALGLSYRREDGQLQGKSSLFAWREQTKRLNVMHWQLGRPPLYISNMHPLCSFTQIGWHIENSFHRFQGNNYVERLGNNTGVDVFRALVKTKPGIVSRFAYGGRVGWALSLLHDIGNCQPPTWRADEYPTFKKIMDALEESVSFFSGDPLFIPYWRNKAVSFTTPEVWASVYIHRQRQPYEEGGNPPKRKKAAVIIFNGGQDRVVEGFKIDPKALGLEKVSRITDAETGIALPLVYSRETGYQFGEIYQQPYTLKMKRHDFRILIVE
ncbi:MAG: DUF6067 family protein [Candidatus Omnitrophica bacterium]|nr:DUF6067 family protein [Candidatus Omnitrophota bacterium]